MEDKREGTGIGGRRLECRSFICRGRKERKDWVECLKLQYSFQKVSAKLLGWDRGWGESPNKSCSWRDLVLGRKALACFVTGFEQPQGKCGFAVSTAIDTGNSSHDFPSTLLQSMVFWKEMGAMRSCAFLWGKCVGFCHLLNVSWSSKKCRTTNCSDT